MEDQLHVGFKDVLSCIEIRLKAVAGLAAGDQVVNGWGIYRDHDRRSDEKRNQLTRVVDARATIHIPKYDMLRRVCDMDAVSQPERPSWTHATRMSA
jgi:hypothetical protein